MEVTQSGDYRPYLLSAVLSDEPQQHILSIFAQNSGPLTTRDLACELAAREDDKPIADVSDDDVRRFLIQLHQVYLPTLETIGWVNRRPEGVVVTDGFPFEDVDPTLPLTHDSEQQWEVLSALLARPRRRHIVTVLSGQAQALALDELATKLQSAEQRFLTVDEKERDLSLAGYLHHIDLPRLDAVGLIEYDSATKTVSSKDVLETVAGWLRQTESWEEFR